MENRILVKVGTNVLTRPNKRLNYNRIMDLANQISKLKKTHQVLLVSSGAAGAGREFFQFKETSDPVIRKQMLASVGQGRLFQVYSEFLKEHSILTAQALITQNDFRSKEHFSNIKATLEGLLANNILPIINENDVVSNRETSFGDNDWLAAMTASMFQADLMVILSDIEGFYTADPKRDPDAKLIPHVKKISPEMLALCEDSLSTGGTGGMYSKLKAAEFATFHGVATIVTSGVEENSLIDAVNHKTGGTYFDAMKRKPLSVHGSWVTTGASLKGTITIDAGAEKALKENKSLLAVGVIQVQGDFEEKDILLIQNKDKIKIGAGLCKIGSSDLKTHLRKNKKPQGVIVIHKNHLYTL